MNPDLLTLYFTLVGTNLVIVLATFAVIYRVERFERARSPLPINVGDVLFILPLIAFTIPLVMALTFLLLIPVNYVEGRLKALYRFLIPNEDHYLAKKWYILQTKLGKLLRTPIRLPRWLQKSE